MDTPIPSLISHQLRHFLLTGVVMATCNLATAAEPFPVGNYRGRMNGFLFHCAAEFKTEQLKARGGERYDLPEVPADSAKCVRDSKEQGKPLFDAALKSVSKAAAKSALKSVQVAYLTSLEGIQPAPGERVGGYERRQIELAGKVNEAWARFEVEL